VSNTYDYLIIRGFAADGQSQNNYLNGLKMQGNFYNDAVIDPYMLERAEVMRGPVSVLYGKSNPWVVEYGQQTPDHRTVERNSVQDGH
jgi:iron complex outermembrane receptor protein